MDELSDSIIPEDVNEYEESKKREIRMLMAKYSFSMKDIKIAKGAPVINGEKIKIEIKKRFRKMY